MSLIGKVVLEEDDLKVTLIGEKPVKGKMREVIEIDYVGDPLFTVDLEGEGLEPISSRQTLRRALGVICADLIQGQHNPSKLYKGTWNELVRKTSLKSNIPALQEQLDAYHDALRHDYAKNKHFKVRPSGVDVTLYDLVTGDDYFKILFKVKRPTKYTITCGIGSRRDGVVRHASYSRDFCIANTDYLFKQIQEWIVEFDASVRPPAYRTANMKAGVKSRYESIKPLIENLLTNLNEGNNV